MIRRHHATLCSLGMLWTAACAPSSLVDVAPTNALADPAVVASVTGATQMYNFAISGFANAFGGHFGEHGPYVFGAALWTDELLRVQGGVADQGYDERGTSTAVGGFNNLSTEVYFGMHSSRVESQQAREALRVYAPNASLAWQSRMQSQEGYAILFLAEIFCSGIPLTSVPLTSGSPAYTRGFTTQELLEHAVALFDSATTLAGDSTRFAYLAKLGKGRALLGLGRFAEASAAVVDIPTDFVYKMELGGATTMPNTNDIGSNPRSVQVVDNEGGNGLVWSTDPRAAIVTTPSLSGAMKVPAKYSVTANGTLDATVSVPNTPIRLADGLEARLIEAESALATNDAHWLTTLNALRSSCIGTTPCAPVPGLTAISLPTLTDPGSADARLDMLMRERAMWLYLTGHRQGDLRRLVHVYHRDPLTLWPMGQYVNPGFPPLIQPTTTNGATSYTPNFVLQTFNLEAPANPLYSGCYDLNP